jgi:hypothetical protein
MAHSDFSGPVKSFWTYRRYFQSIQEVLVRDDFAALKQAVNRQLNLADPMVELDEVRIYAEKHGNWYHPAKIEVQTPEGQASFVLNAALTARGRSIMSCEIRALTYLRDQYPYPWLPTVYFQTEILPSLSPFCSEQGDQPLSFFLADWFEGFHEFHLSSNLLGQSRKLVLWDGRPEPTYLSKGQTRVVYQQISKILTCYYNVRTYEQIFPWHHGAGDFVVKIDGKKVEVRLVTVRQYKPMAEPEEMEVSEALLFFFLNLSVRMRLDRLDGQGEIAWAGEACLESTWEGFLEGLTIKQKEGILAPGFRNYFLKWLNRFSGEELTERFLDLLNSYSPKTPDLPVIIKNITLHIQQVQKIILTRGR